MNHQLEETEPVLGNQRPVSTLRNLVFVVMVCAGLTLFGRGWAVVLEVYRNLGGNVTAWIVCGLLVLIGLFVLWGSYVQVSTWNDVVKRSPRKGGLVATFVVVMVAGVFGSALGRNLDWRLDWASGVAVEGKAREWLETQSCVGWLLATSAVVGVWTIVTLIRTGQDQATR